jgi:putative transposase
MSQSRFDPQKHNRRSIRLPNYDYSQPDAYYVTIVAWQRECLFGEVVNKEMKLNRYGEIINHAWFDLPEHYRHVSLGAFIIMPNHVHGIIVLNDDRRGGSILGDDALPDVTIVGRTTLPSDSETRPYKIIKRHALPEIVRAFKSFSARRINVLRRMQGIPVWQRNYYEHIIRNEKDLQNKTDYIEANPMLWGEDDENPVKPTHLL